MDIITNPAVLAVSSGACVYAYLLYTRDQDQKNKDKKINLMIPLVVSIVVFVLAWTYTSFNEPEIKDIPMQMNVNHIPVGGNDELSPLSFQLVGKSITVPDLGNRMTIPDVFIENY